VTLNQVLRNFVWARAVAHRLARPVPLRFTITTIGNSVLHETPFEDVAVVGPKGATYRPANAGGRWEGVAQCDPPSVVCKRPNER
jgi:hypothetical protein